MLQRMIVIGVASVWVAVHWLGSSVARAEVYDIDPDHTEVRFTWDHLGMSRQGGRFTAVTGTLHFNPTDPSLSRVSVRIPLKSIQTGVKKLDDHLINSREFFDVVAHPEISFTSTQVEPTGARTARVTGDLAMNGITRPVVLDVTWNFSGEHPLAAINPTFAGIYASGFSATTQLRRSDWGLTRTIPWVSDEILISIETELHRRPLPVIAHEPPDGAPAADAQQSPTTVDGTSIAPTGAPVEREDARQAEMPDAAESGAQSEASSARAP